jgi:RNA polymerase sigma-70 factor (ECF subfamily)
MKESDPSLPEPSIPDAILVQRAQNADTAAFGELVALHHAAVFHFINTRIDNHHDTEDLCQRTWAKAWTGLPTFRRDSSFRTWLLTIARHKVAHFYRDRQQEKVATSVEWEALAESAESLQTAPEAVQSVCDARHAVECCLSCIESSLPVEQQVAVMLSDIYGLHDGEVSQRMRVSVPRLKHLLHTARVTMDERSGTACAFVRKTGAWSCRDEASLPPAENGPPTGVGSHAGHASRLRARLNLPHKDLRQTPDLSESPAELLSLRTNLLRDIRLLLRIAFQ